MEPQTASQVVDANSRYLAHKSSSEGSAVTNPATTKFSRIKTVHGKLSRAVAGGSRHVGPTDETTPQQNQTSRQQVWRHQPSDPSMSSNNVRKRQAEEIVVEEFDTSSVLGRRQGVLAVGSRHVGPADKAAPQHRTSRGWFLRRRVMCLPVYHRCPPSRLFTGTNSIRRRRVQGPAEEADTSRSILLGRFLMMEKFGIYFLEFVVVVVTQMSNSPPIQKNISLGFLAAIFTVFSMESWVMPSCKVTWKIIIQIASDFTELLALYLALCILKPEWLNWYWIVMVYLIATACACYYELNFTRQNTSTLYQDIKTKFTWCCEKGYMVISYVIDKVLKPRKDQASLASAPPHASV